MTNSTTARVGYAHPDARALTAAVQLEYAQLYGSGDESPVDVTEFDEPAGYFTVRYVGATPVAMGGWRLMERPPTGVAGPAAELKRLYVVPEARGHGHAKAVLIELEGSAAAAGVRTLVLETGSRQPAAIDLYRRAGYLDIPAFGHYADSPESVHLGKELPLT